MQSRLTGGMPAKLSQGPRTGYDLSRMGAGAARGFNGKKKLEAAPWSGTWPAPGATLDLDFANNRGFVRGLGQGGVMDGITFTRASNGTFVGPDGLLKGGGNALGKNLLAFPQDFDTAGWSGSGNKTYQFNAPDPIGTNTATIVTTTNSANVYFDQTITVSPNTTYTFSFYAKGDSSSPAVGAIYNVTGSANIVVFNYVSSLSSTSFTRIVQTFTTPAGCTSIRAGILWYPNLPIGSLTVWGAQLELGSTATEYFPTNINVPRFDWASTEQVAANLVQYSEQFEFWSASAVTVATDQIAAPNGTTTAELITESGNSSHRVVRNYAAVAGTAYTLSCHFKNNDRRFAALTSVNFNNVNATFDLVAGTSASNTGHATSIQDVGGGWWRCSVSFVATTTTTSSFLVGVNNSNNGAGPQDYASQGLSLYIWGAQIDAAATATNYKQTGAFSTTNTPLRPAATCNGLLIEEARTNRLLWCRDATQTNWVKTDITAAKDQTGIDGVANAASSLTATADGGTCVQTITLASGSRTGSVFLKRLTGTGTVQVSLDGTTWSTVDLSSSEWRRIVLSGAVTNPVVGVRIATSGDAVAMDYGQVEDRNTNGPIVTSPIITTSAAATRAADATSITGSNFNAWFNRKHGTFYCEAKSDVSLSTNNSLLLTLSGGVINQGYLIYPILGVFKNFDGTNGLDSSSVPSFNQFNRIASFYDNAKKGIAVNGIRPNYGTFNNSWQTATSLNLSTLTAAHYVKRLIYFPVVFNDNGYIAITGGAT